MGSYDTFLSKDGNEDVQLKAAFDDETGMNSFETYRIGDKVNGVSDGIYLGYGGAVVVVDQVHVGLFTSLHDKWGTAHETELIFDLMKKERSKA